MKLLKSVILLLFTVGIANGQSFLFEKWETMEALADFGSFTSSLVDTAGNIWVGGNSAAIAKYSNETWEIYDLDTIFEGQLSSFTRIDDLFEDSASNIWAISNKGIFKLSGNEWIYFKDELEKSFGYTIAEKGDTLYFSTRGGVMTLVGDVWDYIPIVGNQPGYVAVDGSGSVWVSFSNGDGNYKLENGEWKDFDPSNSDICTSFGLDIEASPNGDLWFIGASGSMCRFDGSKFFDYLTDGGVIGSLSDIAISPSGDHVFIGGDDFINGKKIKHFYKNGLVEVHDQNTGLAEVGEVTAMSMLNESEIIVFYEDEIFRGFRFSASKEVKTNEIQLVSTLVQSELRFKNNINANCAIFSSGGTLLKNYNLNGGVIGISDLPCGIYFLRIFIDSEMEVLKFVKE